MVFPAGPKLTFSMLAAAAFPPIAPAMSWIIKLIMVLDMFLSQEPMPASQQACTLGAVMKSSPPQYLSANWPPFVAAK